MLLKFLVFTAIVFNLITCIPYAIQLAYIVELGEGAMLTFRILIHVMLAGVVYSIYGMGE